MTWRLERLERVGNAAFNAKSLALGFVSYRLDAVGIENEDPMASQSDILALFRSLHRTARHFTDYNIREYIKRRTADGFRQNRDVADASALLAEGKAQLEVAKRQAVVYSLYAPNVRSIMELKN